MTFFASLKSIPRLLQVAALASLALGVVFPLTALIPGATFNLAGTSLSHEQVWASGVAFAILASAPLMLTVGLGILFHGRWVRWLLVALPVLQFLPFQAVHWYFGGPNPTPSLQAYILFCSAWAAGALVYLFLWSPAKRFFEHARA